MKKDTRRIVVVAMFAALIVVLQVAATFIHFGGFPITLTLVPIIVAGALYGTGTGALMGTVFGIVVLAMVVTGADPSGQAMLGIHPLVTTVVCVFKGTACGAASAAVYRLLSRRWPRGAAFAAAVVCPVVNTGCLYLTLVLFFDTALAVMFSAFISVNFLIELAVNVILAPTVVRLVDMRRRTV